VCVSIIIIYCVGIIIIYIAPPRPAIHASIASPAIYDMIASSMMQEDIIMMWMLWVILSWAALVVVSAAIATMVGRFLGWEDEA
jgi:hypothetical protein